MFHPLEEVVRFVSVVDQGAGGERAVYLGAPQHHSTITVTSLQPNDCALK